MSVDRWLRAAVEDAERRGLPELKPLLENLAAATVALRSAEWDDSVPGLLRTECGVAETGEGGGDR